MKTEIMGNSASAPPKNALNLDSLPKYNSMDLLVEALSWTEPNYGLNAHTLASAMDSVPPESHRIHTKHGCVDR